eukprot:270747-Karenia_brevis.AAC.1
MALLHSTPAAGPPYISIRLSSARMALLHSTPAAGSLYKREARGNHLYGSVAQHAGRRITIPLPICP